MSNLQLQKSLLAAGMGSLLLVGCASTPDQSSQYQQLEQRIERLEPAPGQAQYAPVAVAEAREALQKLRGLGKDSAAQEHQLYITEKRIEIAEEMVATEEAQEVVDNADIRRKDILLEAKTREAEEAKTLGGGYGNARPRADAAG